MKENRSKEREVLLGTHSVGLAGKTENRGQPSRGWIESKYEDQERRREDTMKELKKGEIEMGAKSYVKPFKCILYIKVL